MLFAPADFVAVTVPADERGGCGCEHRRPEGASPWALSCEACEPFLLATDARWARTMADIPETYDQKKDRESLAIRGGRDRDDILALALAKLAGLDLPASLAGIPDRLAVGTGAVAGSMACPAGHVQSAGQAYCGACGLPMRSPADDGQAA